MGQSCAPQSIVLFGRIVIRPEQGNLTYLPRGPLSHAPQYQVNLASPLHLFAGDRKALSLELGPCYVIDVALGYLLQESGV